VDEALFCHRCGRPVRELVEEPEIDQEHLELPRVVLPAVDQAPPAPASSPINLKNGLAVRVALMAAALAQIASTVVTALGFLLLLPVVILGFGGWAVLAYRRRSGLNLSVQRGAQLGWITGLFSFLITTVFFTLSLSMQASQSGLKGVFERSFESLGVAAADMERALRLLDSPGFVVFAILASLAIQFLFTTVVSSMGGALAARWLHRKQS
jgi:hypothetical protein